MQFPGFFNVVLYYVPTGRIEMVPLPAFMVSPLQDLEVVTGALTGCLRLVRDCFPVIHREEKSPLSSLLSNILLHERAKEMEKPKLHFVRYMPDLSVYSKTENETLKIGNNIYLYLCDKLKLPSPTKRAVS